jgi:hypothetical protein
VIGWLNAKGERASALALAKQSHLNARDLARDSRLYEDLKSAYVDLLEYFDLMREIMHRTEPMIGPQPPPPDFPNSNEIRIIWARVGALGSEQVIDALEEAGETSRQFFMLVNTVGVVRQQQGLLGDEVLKLNEARDRYYMQFREIERMIRAELRAQGERFPYRERAPTEFQSDPAVLHQDDAAA